jgi:thymidylate synthase ThyX
MERSRSLFEDLGGVSEAAAGYAVALAFRIRYSMQMNAREAIHLIELRSGPQGHPSYRRVAQQMHLEIAERAGHRAIAEAMVHVDHGASDLERLEAERRAEQRRLRAVPEA